MISVEGVASSVGACGTGKGGWCGWGMDYLTISMRPRSKKKVGGEEAAQQEEGSPARRQRCKKKGRRRGG